MFGKEPKTDQEITQEMIGRQQILWLPPQVIMTLMTVQRWIVNDNNLPEDVIFHSVFWEPYTQMWGVICLSKSFKRLKVGEKAPDLPPITLRYWNPAKDGAIE